MFDIGWSELLVIAVVALIVVGPQDLPVMFRTLGRFTGKARAMAREFTQAMNEAADDAGMRGLQRDLNDLANPRSAGVRKMQEAADAFEKWDPLAERSAVVKDTAAEGAETAALRAARAAETAERMSGAEARATAAAAAAAGAAAGGDAPAVPASSDPGPKA